MDNQGRRLRILDILIKQQVTELADVVHSLNEKKAEQSEIQKNIENNQYVLDRVTQYSQSNNQALYSDPAQMANLSAYYGSLQNKKTLMLETRRKVEEQASDIVNQADQVNRKKRKLEELLQKKQNSLGQEFIKKEIKNMEELYMERITAKGMSLWK